MTSIHNLKRLIRESILKEMDIPKGILKLMGSMRKKGRSYQGKDLDKVLAVLGGWSIDEIEDPKDPKKIILVVKSPSGKEFRPKGYGSESMTASQFEADYPANLYDNKQRMTDWLYNDTELLDQINSKLGTEPYLTGDDKKRAREKDGIDMGILGTCPCCFGTFKLLRKGARNGSDRTMPGMVLHGYKRPGTGYAEGECHGVGWPPFELSKEGTEDFLKWLEEYLPRIESIYKSFKEKTDSISKDDPNKNQFLFKLRSYEEEISSIKRLVPDLKKKIEGWVPKKIDDQPKM